MALPLAQRLNNPDVYASAPGRVEFIGNHTDYNGGWVLGATIDRRVAVGLSRREDDGVTLESDGGVPSVRVSLGEVEAQTEKRTWANYVLGVLSVLREEGLDVGTGFDLQVRSTLPVGAGLSSSAALELAAAFALNEAYGGGFDRKALALAGQRAENEFVGVPCGFLDQAVVAFGNEDRLVCLNARTEEVPPFRPGRASGFSRPTSLTRWLRPTTRIATTNRGPPTTASMVCSVEGSPSRTSRPRSLHR